MLSEQQVNRAIELYADMIKKICMLHLKITLTPKIFFKQCS